MLPDMPSLRIHQLFLFSTLCSPAFCLWPEPQQFDAGTSVVWVGADLDVQYYCQNGYDLVQYSTNPSLTNETGAMSQLSEQQVVISAIRRTQQAIATTQFVPWKFYSRRADFEPSDAKQKILISEIQLQQSAQSSTFDPSTFFAGDESYNISITVEGIVTLAANSSLGSIRALQTLEQLFYAHSSSGGIYTPYAPLIITDSPAWPHRGVNLDISRNPFARCDVLRTLDGMATAKMSRLHLHATDAQSWPIEIPALPDLAAKGAYQSYLTWTPKDLYDVQLYGLCRGISVFLEIDMPGHTGAIANAYPDLITAFNESDWSTFAAEPPSGQLKLNSSAVYSFLDTLFGDLLPRVSPLTTLFHNGGDEVNNDAFLLDETVKSNSSEVLQPLVQKLMSHVTDTVRNASLRPIVWEEMLLDWNLTLPSAISTGTGNNSACSTDTLIQVWRSSANLLLVLQQGYRVLFGDYNHWYLDCGHGGFINPYPSGFSPPGVPYNTSGGVATQIHDPFLDYCNPLKNWRHIYTYDPLANITSELQYLIEGGEVHLWTEQTDPVDLHQKLWPRAAAAAEVLWSGPRSASMIEDASKRLGEWRERVVIDKGVPSGVVQMTWCLMEGGCDL